MRRARDGECVSPMLIWYKVTCTVHEQMINVHFHEKSRRSNYFYVKWQRLYQFWKSLTIDMPSKTWTTIVMAIHGCFKHPRVLRGQHPVLREPTAYACTELWGMDEMSTQSSQGSLGNRKNRRFFIKIRISWKIIQNSWFSMNFSRLPMVVWKIWVSISSTPQVICTPSQTLIPCGQPRGLESAAHSPMLQPAEE